MMSVMSTTLELETTKTGLPAAGTKMKAREALRPFTVFSPPSHEDGTVHHRRADALADEHEHEPVAH